MAIKVRNLDKKVNKNYFHEDYRGTEVLRNLGEIIPKKYRAFVKLSKMANTREMRSRVLETMVYRYVA